MKKLITLFFIFSNLFVLSQITGTVTNMNNKPIEFATIFNLSIETSCITNIAGVFQLEGNIGDSIRIQHVNILTESFVVNTLNDNYEIKLKIIKLKEVVISAGYAFRLFEKSCKNTYNSFKDKNISRGYLRYLSTINKDTVQIIDLDLDIVQGKYKSFEKGLRITPRKVQERNFSDTTVYFYGLSPLFPHVNFTNWTQFSKRFNYVKVEDSQYIKLYFSLKKSLADSINNMEVIIQKSDTCLLSIARIDKNNLIDRNGNDIQNSKTLLYIEYSYTDRFGYLLNHYYQMIVSNPKNREEDISVSLFYKTFNNGLENIKKRENGHIIFDNILETPRIKNRYNKKFWESNSFINEPTYDFEHLFNFKISAEKISKSASSKLDNYKKRKRMGKSLEYKGYKVYLKKEEHQ